jgi:hypothetical protein
MFEQKVQTQEQITAEQIKEYCNAYLRDAQLGITEIINERELNLQRYDLRPNGKEVNGRSQVQTSDVSDAIDFKHAQLMELFTGGDVVEFIPTNENDIEAAEQETDVVNYVFREQNNGFLLTDTWFKDANLQKNGIVKVYWDSKVNAEREEYTNVDYFSFLKMIEDADVSIEDIKLSLQGNIVADNIDSINQIILQTPPEVAAQTFVFEIVLRRKNTVGQVLIENIPPENFFVKRDHNSLNLDECLFTACVYRKTVAELINDGFDADKVRSLPSVSTNYSTERERVNRFYKENIAGISNSIGDLGDTKIVEIYECYARIDINNDGTLELLRVILAGTGGTEMLAVEEVDSNPFIAITPKIMPHKFFGKCDADSLVPIQDWKTAIARQITDNVYYANNPDKLVNYQSLDDGGENAILSTDIGNIIPVTAPDAVTYNAMPFVAANTLPILQLIDDYSERRSGVSKLSQGIDASLLKDQSMFIGSKMINASQQSILFTARVFAEVGFKPLFRKIHELLSKHQDKEMIVNLRGKYVRINPREWRKRTGMRTLVGTGNSTSEMKIAALQGVQVLQEKVFAASNGEEILVDAKKIYNGIADLIKLSGLKDVARYFNNPEDYTPPPPEPPVESDVVKLGLADMQTRKEIKEMDIELSLAELESKANIEREKLAFDLLQLNTENKQKQTAFTINAAAKILKSATPMVMDITDKEMENEKPQANASELSNTEKVED